MDGELTVTSQPGKGSTFAFEVQMPVANAADMARPVETIAASAGPLRILTVDDVEMNRELCKAILTRAGHKVTLADSGGAAIRLLMEKTFDLVLMDIQMPEMDGIEVTKRIRALPDGRGALAIVALTANVMADQISLYKDAGMDGHIGKPIVRADLLAKVVKWGAPVAATDSDAPAVENTQAQIHDQAMFDELRSFVSGAMVNTMVGHLHAAIANIAAADAVSPSSHKSLRDAAHKAVALAGQLGFIELAEAFRSLESACLRGHEVREALAVIQSAAVRARKSIDTLAAAA